MLKECLNCGHKQEVKKDNVHRDELGRFIVCKKCNSSYDID